VVPLDVIANSHRRRHKPDPQVAGISRNQGPNLVEMAYRQYHAIDDDLATPEKTTQTTPIEKEES